MISKLIVGHIGTALVGGALLASPSAQAQAYPTIVGEWYAEEASPEDCGTPFATHIGPMSYAEDTYVCRFDNVARNGWEVTWNGSCHDGSAGLLTQVIATETNGRLSVSFNGNPAWSALRRCTK